MQVSAASASGCPADLDTISEELFRQLSSGQTVNLAAVLSRARDRSQSHSPADAQLGGYTPTLPGALSDLLNTLDPPGSLTSEGWPTCDGNAAI